MFTAVDEHQLPALYVSLGKVQDVSGGGALQSQVTVARWCDNILQALRWSI